MNKLLLALLLFSGSTVFAQLSPEEFNMGGGRAFDFAAVIGQADVYLP
jgi:hypothetical protein